MSMFPMFSWVNGLKCTFGKHSWYLWNPERFDADGKTTGVKFNRRCIYCGKAQSQDVKVADNGWYSPRDNKWETYSGQEVL